MVGAARVALHPPSRQFPAENKVGGGFSLGAPPLSSSSVHPTCSLCLSFGQGTLCPHHQPLHTFSPSIFRSKTNTAQLPAWGEPHGPACPRRGGKRPGSEQCTAHAGEQMCPAPGAHPWPGPESRSSALRLRNYIICSSVQSSFYRKKNVKKYKLLLCEIKVPLSGASGCAGSWGRARGRAAQPQ